MISSLFYFYLFKDIIKQIDSKFFLNIPLKNYEIFTINTYFYEPYYNFFSKKNSLNIFANLNSNIYDNISYYVKLIKDNNYNKEGIVLLYGYITYLVITKYSDELENLENYYFLYNKINKKKELRNLTYLYYDLRLPYYLFLDLISRHLFSYPDITSYLKKASKNCYYFNKYFLAKESKIKTIFLKILGRINKKNYLKKQFSYQDKSLIYSEIIDKSTQLINSINKMLYYNKDVDLKYYLDLYGI